MRLGMTAARDWANKAAHPQGR